MKLFRTGLAAIVIVQFAVAPGAAQEQHAHEGAPPEVLGTVHFPTSCSKDAAPAFDRAVALLHSFWFAAAIDAFNKVLEIDPSCGITQWGVALARWGNPLVAGRSPETLAAGLAAVEKGRAIGSRTERERDYLAAVELLYKDHERLDHGARALAYEQAMERLAQKYPDDTEAAIFYAISLNGTADPMDKKYTKLLKAADILEREFEKQPNHPGIAHYIIHSYDVPPLAERALPAARSYAKIAPSAPHALHMPSHTFTRLGYWQDSIETNIRSAVAAEKANSPSEVLHAYDYMVYAYLQTGQDAKAKDTLDKAFAVKADTAGGYGPSGIYALAAIPARYTLERGDWRGAAAIEVRRTPTPFVDAISYFARALGSARAGEPAAARADLQMLVKARDALAKDGYWSRIIEVQRQSAEAWILLADGRRDEALALMRSAADLEDTTEKSPITPGPIAPARELLGEMLLEVKNPKEALVAFEATVKKEPNRFRGLYGAARAAELAGDRAKARAYYSQLLEVATTADAGARPEIGHAKTFLGTTQQ
jgi:tetratricopeptide (TPR) repeat protein